MSWLVKMVCRNGVFSSTRASLMVVVLLTSTIVLSCCFVMVYAVVSEGKVAFDYFTGIAAVIGSASVLTGSAGMAKAFSDRFNRKVE